VEGIHGEERIILRLNMKKKSKRMGIGFKAT
jgi:hypothetical protein